MKFRLQSALFKGALLLALHIGSASYSGNAQCSLQAPSSVTVDSYNSCSVSFNWTSVASAEEYKVKYKRVGTTSWKGNLKVAGLSHTFTGLVANTEYQISVQSVCSGGATSNKSKKVNFFTTSCTLPASYSAVSTGLGIEQLSIVAACSFDTLYCRYGASPDSLTNLVWSRESSLSIPGLQTQTQYYFQLSTCPLTNNNFTPVDSFTVTDPLPNILVILVDDARSDLFSCNGAPEFMQTPAVDRIANEGVNFKNSFVVHSLCAPSRAAIATGTYTHRHGVYDNVNQSLLNPNLALVPKLMHQNGYSTALVGKNHAVFTYNSGEYFDYWLEFTSKTDGYDLQYKYLSQKKTIQGYGTDVLSDSAVGFIKRTQQPFLLWLSYHAPHEPLIPAEEYADVFDHETIPQKADTALFTSNYPSSIYDLGGGQANPSEAAGNLRETYEMVLSVDKGIGRVLDALDSLGKLDNTLVIFTSDNGHMIGEHGLDMKRVAYEPSIRIPLFVRYPAWFEAGVIDSSNFALNIDIAPTIFEAAGLTDVTGMDGQSLRNFSEQLTTRHIMYYHYWYSLEGAWDGLPPIRAVRDKNYVLIDYSCTDQVVQEFFDLQNDPLQLTNQINNSTFDSLINSYRIKLDSFILVYGDTTEAISLPCSLVNQQYTRLKEEEKAPLFRCYPNPAAEQTTIENFSTEELALVLTNELGQRLFRWVLPAGERIKIATPPPGIYFLRPEGSQKNGSLKLVIQ